MAMRHTRAWCPSMSMRQKFSRRWTWEYAGGEKTYRMSPPVAANGLVYFSLEQSAADSQDAKKIIYTNTLMALSEHDGSVQWRTPQTLDGALSAPGVSGTRLAMARLERVHTFDAVSGVKLAQRHATADERHPDGDLAADRSHAGWRKRLCRRQ